MRRKLTFGLLTSLFTLFFGAVSYAAGSPITNGSFQTGDFTGWTVSDSTRCHYGVCGNGTASVQVCNPSAPGDTDGFCASLAGANVRISQAVGNTSVHKYTLGACLKHSGSGTVNVYGSVQFSLSGDTGWVCQTKMFTNTGGPQRIAPITVQNSGGTAYADQFTFVVNQP